MHKLLITGASGFLGTHLIQKITKWQVHAAYHKNKINYPQALSMDICDKQQVERIFQSIRPSAVIHGAAMSMPSQCSKEKEKAIKINVEGTKNIAQAAQKFGTRMVYLSTDLVFSGNGELYSEKDHSEPICHYGQTKQQAEQVVLDNVENYCIARLALIYGWSLNNRKCFTEIIIDKLKAGESIDLFIDEYRSPVYIEDLCRILPILAKSDIRTLFHVGGAEKASRYDIGQKVCKIFGFCPDLIHPISVDNVRFDDGRPKDCSMNSQKLENFIGKNMTNIDEGLQDMHQKCST